VRPNGDSDMIKITECQRDRIQRQIFDSIYKHNEDLSNEERFAKAIVGSNDTVVNEAIKNNPQSVWDYHMYLLENEAYKMNIMFDKKRKNDLSKSKAI